MPRTLSIWLPQLPLDRLIRRDDPRVEGYFALIIEDKNAWRITHTNSVSRKAGIESGQSLADARAICPDLLTEPCDAVREEALLRTLWRWADVLSPQVALDSPDGLLLNIDGCAHLFGGEVAMADYARTRLNDLRITARIGIADTKLAARGLARFGAKSVNIAQAGQTKETVARLPIAALGLSPAITTDLARTGITRIGQLNQQKSSELARRFGLELTNTMNAITGQTPDPVIRKKPDSVYAARMTLPDPVGLLEDIEQVLSRLATHVCNKLKDNNKGARQFNLTVRCVDTGDHTMTIGFAQPSSDSQSVIRQFNFPLSKLKIDYGADWFRLSAHRIEHIEFKQISMGERSAHKDSLYKLIDTLANRVGFNRVRVFQQHDSFLPEQGFEQVGAAKQEEVEWTKSERLRPIRLFNPPEYAKVETAGRPPKRFVWRDTTFDTKTANGPERLTPRWFKDKDLRTRDYWIVQTEQGQRLWLLTYPGANRKDWYVAGEFG